MRDYEVWQHIFDTHASAHRATGMNLVRLWRAVDEPNNIFFAFEISDIERAKAYTCLCRTARKLVGAGVLNGEIQYVEESEGY